MPNPAYRSNLRSRDNSPRRRNENSSSEKETVTVFCRIRHVSGVKQAKNNNNDQEYTIESSSQDSETETEETDNNYSVCKIVDPKTVQLTTIDKRKDCEVDARYTFTQAFSPAIGQKPIFDTGRFSQCQLWGGNYVLGCKHDFFSSHLTLLATSTIFATFSKTILYNSAAISRQVDRRWQWPTFCLRSHRFRKNLHNDGLQTKTRSFTSMFEHVVFVDRPVPNQQIRDKTCGPQRVFHSASCRRNARTPRATFKRNQQKFEVERDHF